MTLRAEAALAAALVLGSCGVALGQQPGQVGAAAGPAPAIREKEVTLPRETAGALARFDRRPIGRSDCPVAECTDAARERKMQNFISGADARPAGDLEYGFVVAIFYDRPDGRQYVCTGSLLTPQLVLTAGHCACGMPGTYRVSFHQDARDHRRRTSATVSGSPILFDQRICRGRSLWGGRDLALIRLVQTAKTEDKVPIAVRIPGEHVWDLRELLERQKKLTVVGYGYSGSSTIGVRMQTTVPVLSALCDERSFAWRCAAFSEMILADARGPGLGNDTCGGDSGGPVLLVENDRPRLIGVTSRAAPGVRQEARHHCGGGGVYTLLGRKSVHDWLRANGVTTEEPDPPTR